MQSNEPPETTGSAGATDSNQPGSGASSGSVEHERPLSITIISLVMLVGALPNLALVFSDAAKTIAPWYPTYLGVATGIGIACAIGLFKMMKWAAYLFIAHFIVVQIVLVSSGQWNPLSLIPLILIIFIVKQIPHMKWR